MDNANNTPIKVDVERNNARCTDLCLREGKLLTAVNERIVKNKSNTLVVLSKLNVTITVPKRMW